MRILKLILLLLTLFTLLGCEKKPKDAVSKMHWDRDMCERCKMAISERKFAVEVIDLKRNRVYKFDDLGCAVLWLKEQNIPINQDLKIWITDAKSGQWIDAQKALYTDDSITPMAYGLAAYTPQSLPKNHHTLDFTDAAKKIFEIEKLNTQRVKAQ